MVTPIQKKKLKIALINISFGPSPILLVMHEMIKEKGHDSMFIHMPYLSTISRSDTGKKDEDIEKITDQLMEICGDADLIAFTCLTNTFIASSRFIETIKRRKNIPIAMGGIHSTAKPLECLEYADFACIGEGENAFMELIDRISEDGDVSYINGFYTKKDGKIIQNPQGKLVENLDSLPIPSFDLKNYYYLINGKIVCMENYRNDQSMLLHYFSRYYITVTSRGCPYKCKFCVNDVLKKLSPQYYGVRKKSPKLVIEELKRLMNIIKYPIIVGFADDDFFARSSEEMKEFSQLYKKEVGLPFFCSSTPHSMKEDKIKYAVDAGIYRLEIGIQSINDKTNWEIHGRAGLRKDVERAIKIVSPYRHKTKINYDIILDNPWEPEESVIETLEFMFTIPKPCTFAIFSLVPFPGTSMYKRANDEGLLKDQERMIYNNDMMFLKNNSLNTLVTLYGKYKIPTPFIRFGLKVRKIPPFKTILENSTVPLWKVYNFYEGLKMHIEDKNYKRVAHHLKAPVVALGNVIRRKIILQNGGDIKLTTETLEKKTKTTSELISDDSLIGIDIEKIS